MENNPLRKDRRERETDRSRDGRGWKGRKQKASRVGQERDGGRETTSKEWCGRMGKRNGRRWGRET